VGHAALSVHARPRVAILSTGDELVPVGEPLPPAGIHDSNAVGLAAQAASAGAEVIPLGIAQDRHHAVRERLEEGIRRADVVLASGGVSVGAHDVVKDAFADLGTLELWRVAVQPGKPLAFGRADRPGGGTALFFGLPGNPVSSYVTFELFVRPVLRRLAGHAAPSHRRTVRAALATPVSKAPGRRAFLRVTLARDLDRPEGWLATLAGGQGSHVLSALARADGLAVVPEEVEALPAGSVVEVILLEASED
jgi:molybdopterin molybdotransferase